MRKLFAHDAVVVLAHGGDERAPGALITKVLCGGWDHDGPCPVAPHYTSARRDGDLLRLRVLFAAEPGAEANVRQQLDAALARARLVGPDGRDTRWRLTGSGPSVVRDHDLDHGGRLIES